MKTLVLRILLPIVLIFTMISCAEDPLDTISAAPPAEIEEPDIDYNYSESEFELARLINDYRISKGLNELEFSDYASLKAEEHNLYMIRNNDVSHAGFKERSDDIIKVLGAQKVNECIAYNFPTPELAFGAWKASERHNDDLEGGFTHFGISMKVNPENDKKYYTAIFISMTKN